MTVRDAVDNSGTSQKHAEILVVFIFKNTFHLTEMKLVLCNA